MKGFEINKQIKQAQDEYRENGLSDKFIKLGIEVVNTKNPEQNYRYAKEVKGADILLHGNVVAMYGNAEINYDYTYINGADTLKHRKRIIELGDVKYNILAGKTIKDKYMEEYVNLHGKIVLEKGSLYDNFKYMVRNNIPTFNKDAHLNKIIESKDVYFNLKCAKKIQGADILAHGRVIIENGSAISNFMFLQIEGSDLLSHLEAIINSKDEVVNAKCITEVEGCNIIRHARVVFNGADNNLKFEVLNWAKLHNKLNELKQLPQVNQFIEDIKIGRIKLNNNDYQC